MIKKLSATALIYCYSELERQTVVQRDALNFALSCILSPMMNKVLHPVAFHSLKFNLTELTYGIHNKKLSARVTVFRKWRRYLVGSKPPTIVFTSDKSLEYTMKESPHVNRKPAHWAEFIATFDFQGIYRPGTAGGKADGLLRYPENCPKEGVTLKPAEAMYRNRQVNLIGLPTESFGISIVC